MLTLDLDFGLNTNVEAQEILHLLTKNGDFFYYGQRVMNFLVTLLCCPVLNQIDAMSFILHILLVDDVNKLVNMGLMKISWISDGGTNSRFSQWLWCERKRHSASSSQHDHPGAVYGHPNRGDEAALADATTACSAAAE
jgi:hypothetical protein